jgi:hypothetical protein
MTSNLRLEVVVVGFFSQSRKHLEPHRLIKEDAEGVVGPGELPNLALAEQIGKPLLQCFD